MVNEDIALIESSFRKLNRVYRRRMREIMLAHGIYFGQPQILFALLGSGGSTQKEISEQLSVSQATVAVSIRRLLKGGFITKATDKKDLRRNRIELTEKGQEAAVACRNESDSLFTNMCAGFDTNEIKRMAEYFSRLSENLSVKQ